MLEIRFRSASVRPDCARNAMYADKLSAVTNPGRSPISSIVTRGRRRSPTSLRIPTRQKRMAKGWPIVHFRSLAPCARSGSKGGICTATAVVERPSPIIIWRSGSPTHKAAIFACDSAESRRPKSGRSRNWSLEVACVKASKIPKRSISSLPRCS